MIFIFETYIWTIEQQSLNTTDVPMFKEKVSQYHFYNIDM